MHAADARRWIKTDMCIHMCIQVGVIGFRLSYMLLSMENVRCGGKTISEDKGGQTFSNRNIVAMSPDWLTCTQERERDEKYKDIYSMIRRRRAFIIHPHNVYRYSTCIWMSGLNWWRCRCWSLGKSISCKKYESEKMPWGNPFCFSSTQFTLGYIPSKSSTAAIDSICNVMIDARRRKRQFLKIKIKFWYPGYPRG